MSSYLKFQVSFHTYINQQIRIVGNIKDLGDWDPSKGLQLQTNAQIYPDWTHDTFIEIPRGIVIEFKCVKFEGDRLINWERFSIDMNRKYKTQYFKALLFMKEDNIQVIERPFQKYTGNHDYDIIDTTNAKKIQEKFMKFDPLRKADGLSSSSDNSSLDFFRRQSKVSEDFNVIENEMDQYRTDGNAIIGNNIKRIKQNVNFSDDEDDLNSIDIPIKQINKSNCLIVQNYKKIKYRHIDEFQDPNNHNILNVGQNIGDNNQKQGLDKQKLKKKKCGLGIKFNQSSLNQISGNVPRDLENVFLLFNRVKKESQQMKEKYSTIRKLMDLKDISLYNQNICHNFTQMIKQSEDNVIKKLRKVKSMPYLSQQSEEVSEKTFIIVSYRLPYFVRSKNIKSSRLNGDLSIDQRFNFVENFDPLIDSIYQSIINVKLKLIWVGICNIYIESENDQEDIRQYMLEKFKCYPLFYNEEVNQQFARQFCTKFLYPQYDNFSFYEEENCWQTYKNVNMDVANVLKKLTSNKNTIFAIAIYDFHFFLLPSYFQRQKNHQIGHLQQLDQKDKITIVFFMNRKFPQQEIFEALPQSEIFMHSLFFCDVMSFSTYENCEPFLNYSQKMGCVILHKTGGKIIMQCNGREILIRIEHPGINIKKLQVTKDQILKECDRKSMILQEQCKHQIIGIDYISKNSCLEQKFKSFEKFLMKEKQQQSNQEYKLKQIVYFSTDSEFHTINEQLDYLNEIKSLARSINQAHSFYDSAIEIIEGSSLSFEEYFQYLSLSECFFSTVLQETRHFHYMEYLFLKKDGQLILSNCLSSIQHFNAVNIINPSDQSKIVHTLVKVFENIELAQQFNQSRIKLDKIQQNKSYLLKKDQIPRQSSSNQISMYDSTRMQIIDKKRFTLEYDSIDFSSLMDKSRINITEKNNTSDQAQREFDYNYLIKFCSSQNWINHFISDIVKRQTIQKNTCLFFSTEQKTVVLDSQNNNIHRENISKIYERNSEQYIEINLQNLIYRCKNSKNAVFIFGFSSVFFDNPSNLLSEPKLNTLLFKQIEELSKQPNVQIYIISGKSSELLSKYFGHINNIFLIANNGLKIQYTGCDLDFLQLTSKYEHTLWKMQVQIKMENFVQKTAGSYIIESEVQTSWHFENVEKEFADAQKNELIKQLVQIVESMPGNEIFEGYDFVQVRPQCLNKGVMTKIALQNGCLLKQRKIDFLVVVGGKKTTDEEMLKSAREVIYDENVSYVEDNTPVILGSISSQLGALYCNHQFESNQELAVLLEMMNGNKQLLKSDQFILSKKQQQQQQNQQSNTSKIRSNTIKNNHLQNLPALLRNNTIGYPNYIHNIQNQSEQINQDVDNENENFIDYDIQFKYNLSPNKNSQDDFNSHKKKPINIQNMKIPYINQTSSFNKLNKKLI